MMDSASLAARFAAANLDWIVPDWPAPARVQALSTTRRGEAGGAIDFGRRSADLNGARRSLRRWLPGEPLWLAQVHGNAICDGDAVQRAAEPTRPRADGIVAHAGGTVCAVLTADCLPVLFCDRAGSVVGAAHAGWRGLAAGVLEAALGAIGGEPSNVLAWLGPAIGPEAYEVGPDVHAVFCDDDPEAASCFAAHRSGKWLADLYALARRRLARAGVVAVYGGGRCTFTERETFYSFRRGESGRMATLIWLAPV